MRISKLVLEDFRGFRKSTFESTSSNTTVFAGPNGCGKSSVLDAIASAGSGVPSVLAGSVRSVFGGGDVGNIRGGADSARWSLELRQGEGVASFGLGAWHDFATAPEGWGGDQKFGVVTTWAEALSAGKAAEVDLPILTYLHGGSTRSVARREVNDDLLTGRLTAYQGAFDQEAAHFDDFERWYEQEENLENEAKIRSGNLRHELHSLRAVRGALQTFLRALEATEITNFQVLRSHVEGPFGDVRGRLTVKKNDEPLFLDQLSDGERRLILLVGDVARRMAVLNPHLSEPASGPGILLADEIDLHLHPGWQRRVLPALRLAFPNVQLVATTHSPQVLASVDSASVVLMKNFEFLPGHPKVRGRDTNTLLENVFEVPERPEEIKTKLAELYDALDDQPERAQELYRSLERILESDDPELVRIQTLLELVLA
ncbi:MAG: AAA family ATPase [Nannocystales bacterium]